MREMTRTIGLARILHLDGEEEKHGTRLDGSDRRTLGQTIVAMAQYAEELRHWIDAALFAAMEAKRPIQ